MASGLRPLLLQRKKTVPLSSRPIGMGCRQRSDGPWLITQHGMEWLPRSPQPQDRWPLGDDHYRTTRGLCPPIVLAPGKENRAFIKHVSVASYYSESTVKAWWQQPSMECWPKSLQRADHNFSLSPTMYSGMNLVPTTSTVPHWYEQLILRSRQPSLSQQ